MKTILHTWSYGRFLEIQHNFRRKKSDSVRGDSNLLRDSFSNIVTYFCEAILLISKQSQQERQYRNFNEIYREIQSHYRER